MEPARDPGTVRGPVSVHGVRLYMAVAVHYPDYIQMHTIIGIDKAV